MQVTTIEDVRVALDKAEDQLIQASIPLRERIALNRELAQIRVTLLAGPGLGERIKLGRRLAEIRLKLGAAMAVQQTEPAAAATPVEPVAPVPFGLQASGVKTREKLNAQVRGIIARVKSEGLKASDLAPEDLAVLAQYSGRGGLTDNSQSEYYTPPFVAAGSWDLLKANGFTNGNVCEPSTGAGVFSATKPAGVVISGAEIDETSSAVAQLLHPEDRITNTSFERYALSVADSTFDAVIGNVPFGVRGKEAHHDLAFKSEKRMERYFVRRVLDKVRPGGLVSLVVPTSVIGKKDKAWARWRAEVSLMAEFLGGHKLPSKTFGKQGTDTVTDIIVLRKHPQDLLDKVQKLPQDVLKASKVLWDEFLEGRYFQGEGLPFIHGTFVPADPSLVRSQDQVIAPEDLTDKALQAKLAARFESRIDWAMLETAQDEPQAYGEGDRKVINGQPMELRAGQWVPFVAGTEEETVLDKATFGVGCLAELEGLLTTAEGMLSLTANQAFKAWKRYPHLFNGVQSQAVEFAMSQPADKFREVAYRGSLLGAMVSKYAMGDDATDRDRVIGLLEAEFTKYGHPSTIAGMVLDGGKAQSFGAYLGAIDSAGQVSAAVRGEVTAAKGYDESNILSIVTFLGRQTSDAIGIEDIAALYKGPRELKALGDIADIPGLAISANGEVLTTGAYCCGDVYAKVGELQNAMTDSTEERIKAHWTGLISLMLSKVKHTDISEIGFGLRDNWIAPKYKAEFLRLNGYQVKFEATEPVAQAEDGEETESSPARTGGAWVYRGKDEFSKQLTHYLAGLSIGHNLRDRSDAPASERKAEYQSKVNGLEEQFRFFMQSHSDGADLASTYDMTFNRHVTPDYDDSDLGLKGVSANVRTHGYQNAGVRRLSDEGGGILGYDVGLGKTFTSLAYSVYDRQMGRSKKHCIAVPKSVLANWYMESKKMLGTHEGVLFVGFEPKRDKGGAIVTEPVLDENNRPKVNQHTGQVEFQDVLVEDSSAEVFAKMHSIPAMDGGLIVMTYEKFKIIPVKPETVENYGNKWVERSMTSKAAAQRLAGKDFKDGSYAAKQQQANLENNFFNEGTKKKEELPYFEDMGIDRVIVDEAHNFRASFQVKDGMDKLAYLPNPAESQRAQDMAIKLAHVRDQNGGKGSILLTATPVANSPIEIYNMLMHVVPPEELDKLGVYTPADFVRFFGQIQQVQKMLVTGEIGDRDGLKGFRNLNILRGLFHRYANMMSAKDVDPDGNVLKLPDAQEVKSQCDMTSEQVGAYISLRAEAKKAGNPKNIQSGEARPMFAVLRDMDRVTTDIDLYRKTMTFLFKAEDEAKLQALIADLPPSVMREEVDEESGEKVKVPVPREMGFKVAEGGITYVAPEAYEFAVVSRLAKFKIGYVTHPLQPKYAELVKNLKAELAIGGKQLVFTEEKSQHGKLERLLVQQIPEDEARIGIINADTASGEKLQEIVDAYTRGDFDIVICNKKAEVGVNLQRGTTAVHHMTLPWTPASIQQRNGRAVRQGNKMAAVRIYYYQAKGSFDEYRLDLLNKKASWITNLLSKDNSADEHDNENAGSDLEHAALLSDNREEFLAKMAEQQAKKDAEAKERREQAAKIGLNQLSAAREYLRTFDKRRAMAIAEVQGDLDKAERALEAAQGLPDGQDKAKALARRKDSVLRLQAKLKRTGPELDQRRADTEARMRQIVSSLKAQASRGELPFNPILIDSPEDSIVALSKVVVCKGSQYQVRDKHSGGYNIFRVTAVNQPERKVKVEYVYAASVGYGAPKDGEFDVDAVLGADGQETHFSDADLQLMKLLKESITYSDIAARVSKEVFLANASKVRVSGACLRRSKDTGTLVAASWFDPNSKDALVYPDRADKALLKEVAALYAAGIAGGLNNSLRYSAETIMPAFFGSDWQTAIGEYVITASPEAIRSQAMAVIRSSVPALLSTLGEVDAAMAFLNDMMVSHQLDATQIGMAMKAWAQEHEFINLREVLQGALAVARVEYQAVVQRRGQLQQEAEEAEERAKQAAFASDPRFKELTEDQLARFRALSLTARYNNGDTAGAWAPFEALTLKDAKAFGGVLYKVKEMMKPRFGAKFISSKATGQNSPYADTWAVPARTDVEALLNFLEG